MKLSVWIQVALLVIVCAAIGMDKVNEAYEQGFEDTRAYLQMGMFLQDNGGVPGFLPLSLSGRYTSNNQHPFYPLLLSMIASREPMYFVSSKLVSLAGGLLLVVALFLVARSLYGDAIAILAGTFLILNTTFLRMASHVACETFLMLFVVLSMYASFKCAEQARYWTWLGVLAGLAYLTKGTGLLLIPSIMLLACLQYGWAVGKSRHFWMFAGMFLIVVSPLLMRNMIVYGSPFYSGPNGVGLWMDTWWDSYNPTMGTIVQYPEVVWQFVNPPSMSTYLQSHSINDVIARLTSGLRGEFRLLVASLNTILPGPPLGAIMLILSAIGLATETKKERAAFVVVLFAAFFLPFSWFYQVAPATRYLAPLIPVLCLYSAGGVLWILAKLTTTLRGPLADKDLLGWVPKVVVGVLAIIGIYAMTTQDVGIPRASTFGKDEETFSMWVTQKVKHQDLLLLHVSNPYATHSWFVGLNGKIVHWKTDREIKGFDKNSLSYLDELLKNPLAKGRRYVVVYKDDLQQSKGLANRFRYDDVIGLTTTRPIEGWSFAYADPDLPRQYLIYETTFGTTS